MQEPTPDLPTKDWSNKVIAGVFITLTALTWAIYLTNNRHEDSAAIQFLNKQADSLRGAAEEKDKLIVALQRDINRITDTVKIIEQKQTLRYDNYIQSTTNLRPDSTIDTAFQSARTRFRERWEQGVFFER